MSEVINDLDATITSAVMARVEAEVTRALSGDEVIGRLVSSALQQEVEVKRGYQREKKTVLKAALDKAVQDAVRDAITSVVDEERPLIEDEIRKALKRESRQIAEQFTQALVDASQRSFGFRVELRGVNG